MSFTNRESNVWRRRSSTLCLVLLILIVCTNLIVPMLMLLRRSVDFTPFYAGFAQVIGSSTTKQALLNSCVVTITASLLAVSLAFFFAYVVELKLPVKLRPFFPVSGHFAHAGPLDHARSCHRVSLWQNGHHHAAFRRSAPHLRAARHHHGQLLLRVSPGISGAFAGADQPGWPPLRNGRHARRETPCADFSTSRCPS